LSPPIVVVSTCVRPSGVSYLADTIASLDANGAGVLPRALLINGYPTEAELETMYAATRERGWGVSETRPAEPQSSRSNLWRALRLARDMRSDLLFFEDDLIACKNAVTRMAQVVCPDDCAFVSFFDHCPPNRRRADGAWGLHVAPLPEDFDGSGWGGTQALSVPLRTSEYLARLDPFSIRTVARDRQSDKVLADFCAASPWPRFAMHAPTLFRHTGIVSAAHPGTSVPDWRHTPRSYPGDWFDALQSGGPRPRMSVFE